MREMRSNGWLGVALALSIVLAPVPLQSATNIFGRLLSDLSEVDLQSMERAQLEVLETMMPGAVSIWKDDNTGHSGEARLVRNYQQNGMTCGEVEHFLKFRAVSRYVMPLCRVSDGTWRLAY